ncbi:hypothetical protein D1007_14795 [Hordeum vulgare]|nr:hypothetical protein D1007_14795 [Hordeum vulgare]
MAASGSTRRRSQWPDLPAELLGLVLMRLSSHADRVRLPVVCRAWCSAARLQHPLPPLLPWLALPDGTFLSLPDGAVHRLPVPDDVFFGFSAGGALFLMHEDDIFSLVCPSSVATVDLPEPRFWAAATWQQGLAQHAWRGRRLRTNPSPTLHSSKGSSMSLPEKRSYMSWTLGIRTSQTSAAYTKH